MLKSITTRKSSPTMVTKITHYNNLTMRLSLWSVNPYSAQWTLVWNNRIYYLANPSNNWNKIQIWNLDTLLIFLAKIKRPSMFEPSLAEVVAGCGIRISGAPLDITTCSDHNECCCSIYETWQSELTYETWQSESCCSIYPKEALGDLPIGDLKWSWSWAGHKIAAYCAFSLILCCSYLTIPFLFSHVSFQSCSTTEY